MAMDIKLARPAARPATAGNTVVEGEIIPPTNTLQPMRLGLWVLGLGFGGFLLWMGLAPLDEGVPTQGTVAIDTKRKAVQHLSGGIVKEVLVKEGQFVNDGQVVVTLDDAVARATHEAVRQRYLGLRAMEGRLTAEQAGTGQNPFSPRPAEGCQRPPDPAARHQPAAIAAVTAHGLAGRHAGCRGKHSGTTGGHPGF